jgi:hypothetical protein
VAIWRTGNGWDVEDILLGDRWQYRVRRHGYLVAHCASVDELRLLFEHHGVDAADLVEDDPKCESRASTRTDTRSSSGGHRAVSPLRCKA